MNKAEAGFILRYRALRACAIPLLIIAACSSPGEPGGRTGRGVEFRISGVAHPFVGMVTGTSTHVLVSREFAVARPNDVGEATVVAYAPTGESAGVLFALHVPRELGTHPCGAAGEPCRGSYTQIHRDGTVVDTGRSFAVTGGSVNLTRVEPDAMQGSFMLTLRAADDEPGNMITMESGTIDVRYVSDQVTDGVLVCLLARVGLGLGTCSVEE